MRPYPALPNYLRPWLHKVAEYSTTALRVETYHSVLPRSYRRMSTSFRCLNTGPKLGYLDHSDPSAFIAYLQFCSYLIYDTTGTTNARVQQRESTPAAYLALPTCTFLLKPYALTSGRGNSPRTHCLRTAHYSV